MTRPSGKLRIVGGEFRSRIVDFDGESGIRPTPDRVRQTLFDWLMPHAREARCLDLFAGSGALGIEALSRGAEHVHFVDIRRTHLDAIGEALARLRATNRATLTNVDGLAFLAGRHPKPFDIVFLDPPFDSDLLLPALERLPPLLKPGNRVYFEYELGGTLSLPDGYEVVREKQAGQVSYGLATFNGTSA